MKKTILLIVDVLIIVGLAAFGGFYFKKYRDLKNHPVSANQAAQAEVDRTIAAVGKLYALPKDEKPTVATVTDKEATKKQYGHFFDNAENGDISLIYTQAKLAILYRPSTNKIVNVSSVTIQSNARVKVIGSQTARQAAENALQGAQITAIDGGDAKSSPTSVVVVDLTGQNADQTKKVADTVKGTVGTLPAGEDKPTDADILVVAGP
ncbi:MAG TPA: hypothetical protein VLF87_03235 [Patescibacteria group bacterium]|nr:hypothetical protein [Patescibacteria group bacterium]